MLFLLKIEWTKKVYKGKTEKESEKKQTNKKSILKYISNYFPYNRGFCGTSGREDSPAFNLTGAFNHQCLCTLFLFYKMSSGIDMSYRRKGKEKSRKRKKEKQELKKKE